MYKFFLIVLFSIVVGANGNDKHYIENPKVTGELRNELVKIQGQLTIELAVN